MPDRSATHQAITIITAAGNRPLSPEMATSYSYPFVSFLAAAVAVSLWALYRWLLPRPLPGIPYNEKAARSLLGDVPSLIESKLPISQWLAAQVRTHNSPLVQVFLRPFQKPVLILGDYRESQDIMQRRKEFDRSQMMIDFFKGLIADHHLTHKTNDVFKAHRRLVQDLMTPSFLHNVAAPAIYANAQDLITLWQAKARIANGRPFSAINDIFCTALDAVLAFSYGASYPHKSTAAQVERVSKVDARDFRHLGIDAPVDFPKEPMHEVSQAVVDLVDEVETVSGSPSPGLQWMWLKSRPSHRRAKKVQNACIEEQILQAVDRMQAAKAGEFTGNVKSAVDHMVDRECRMAEREGRKPDFLSSTMRDELFGLLVAGHDTTSTTLLWGFKHLAGNLEAQRKARRALEAAHPGALAEERNPTVLEITQTSVPWLEAIIEEILRLAGTAPALNRDAEADTTILGHHVPKGTTVFFLPTSASTPGFAVPETKRSPSSQTAAKERGIHEWDPEDTEAFRPERWLRPDPSSRGKDECDGNGSAEKGMVFDVAAGPNLAFGFGTRGCFGKRLAYLEMRLILTLIIWNFELLPCPEELSSFQPVDGATHKPVQAYVRLRNVRQ